MCYSAFLSSVQTSYSDDIQDKSNQDDNYHSAVLQ